MAIRKLPKYPCSFCRKNEATQFCDFVIGYTGATFYRDGIEPPSHVTCDNQICKECAIDHAGHEFCPSCEELRKYVQNHHDKRPGMMMADIVLGRYEVEEDTECLNG